MVKRQSRILVLFFKALIFDPLKRKWWGVLRREGVMCFTASNQALLEKMSRKQFRVKIFAF